MLKIRDLLAKLGQQREDWVHLVQDQLTTKSLVELRNTLARDRTGRVANGPDSTQIIGVKARNDLAFDPLQNPSRFEIGQFMDDPDQDEAYDIQRSESYVDVPLTDNYF